MNQKRPFSIFSGLGCSCVTGIFLLVFAFTIACKDTGNPDTSGTPSTSNQTPVVGDYNISGLTHTYDGSSKRAIITPKEGKSTGARTILYNGATAAPITAGNYTVIFNVEEADGWNPAIGLQAGTLVINSNIPGNKTPLAAHYNFGNMRQTAGSVSAVTITRKDTNNNNSSPGAISNIRYNNSLTLPTAANTYTVTFDVAAASGWNAANGLQAGNLVVEQAAQPQPQPQPTVKYTVYSNGSYGNGFGQVDSSPVPDPQGNPNGGYNGHTRALAFGDGWGGGQIRVNQGK